MKYNIMTSFNESYWNELARSTCQDLDKNWCKDSNIIFYHELSNETLEKDKKLFSDRVLWIDLYKSIPQISEFKEKWKGHPKANGGIKGFRNNAIKFVHKTFPIWHCYKEQKTDWLIWLDCDALCFKSVDIDFLKSICKENTTVSYLGRKTKYSECGFLAWNLNHPETKRFLEEWEDLYTSGKFIELAETHDSWTFDYVRLKWNRPELFNDLNAISTTDKNPFGNSLIGSHFWHGKGDNKGVQLKKAKLRR